MTIDDNRLMAYADGELAADEAAQIEAEAARDPALAVRIERARALRASLAAAYDDTLAEAPPERLVAAVHRGAAGGADVIDLAKVRRRRASGRAWPAMIVRSGAMAASLAIAFAAGRFLIVAPAPAAGPIAVTAGGGLLAQGPLGQALERQLASTQAPDAPVKIGVSFQATDGRYCRTFITRARQPIAGLACRSPAGWQLTTVMNAEPTTALPGGYATAANAIPAPVLEAVDRTIRSEPLDAAAESRARDAGWK
jgi:anti-sigma factor RsiW